MLLIKEIQRCYCLRLGIVLFWQISVSQYKTMFSLSLPLNRNYDRNALHNTQYPFINSCHQKLELQFIIKSIFPHHSALQTLIDKGYSFVLYLAKLNAEFLTLGFPSLCHRADFSQPLYRTFCSLWKSPLRHWNVISLSEWQMPPFLGYFPLLPDHHKHTLPRS